MIRFNYTKFVRIQLNFSKYCLPKWWIGCAKEKCWNGFGIFDGVAFVSINKYPDFGHTATKHRWSFSTAKLLFMTTTFAFKSIVVGKKAVTCRYLVDTCRWIGKYLINKRIYNSKFWTPDRINTYIIYSVSPFSCNTDVIFVPSNRFHYRIQFHRFFVWSQLILLWI